ncbi:MAG: ribonuclease P protein component [Polyangiales bacterium]
MHRASEPGGRPIEVPDQGFARTDRLRKRFEFRQVQLHGRRIHTPHFLLVVQPNSLDNTRLGITVTKKVGNAVKRNRIKRVVREVFRRNRSMFPRGFDVVFIAKAGAHTIEYDTVLRELRRAARKMRPEPSP